eukprot:CAMPEP_0178776152 /NCGR_PEP_ID=MMETSP0744-20121128/24573_1 /TAXON_ID=913974 /ORGANISM="Nitzschia punctata, Strain CCMP561" /LENGTH=312 /DNA_ID=CAMNT_0020433177 /DNA_START=174 /DNA_END=1112 /DNA_ORIENTATION=-
MVQRRRGVHDAPPNQGRQQTPSALIKENNPSTLLAGREHAMQPLPSSHANPRPDPYPQHQSLPFAQNLNASMHLLQTGLGGNSNMMAAAIAQILVGSNNQSHATAGTQQPQGNLPVQQDVSATLPSSHSFAGKPKLDEESNTEESESSFSSSKLSDSKMNQHGVSSSLSDSCCARKKGRDDSSNADESESSWPSGISDDIGSADCEPHNKRSRIGNFKDDGSGISEKDTDEANMGLTSEKSNPFSNVSQQELSKQWLILLAERPADSSDIPAMSAWLRKVMELSNHAEDSSNHLVREDEESSINYRTKMSSK